MSKRRNSIKMKTAETDKNRSTNLRRNFRLSHNKTIGKVDPKYNNVKGQIYAE